MKQVIAEGLPVRSAALAAAAAASSAQEEKPKPLSYQRPRFQSMRLKPLSDIDDTQLRKDPHTPAKPTDVIINRRGRLYVYWSDGSLRRATKKEKR